MSGNDQLSQPYLDPTKHVSDDDISALRVRRNDYGRSLEDNLVVAPSALINNEYEMCHPMLTLQSNSSMATIGQREIAIVRISDLLTTLESFTRTAEALLEHYIVTHESRLADFLSRKSIVRIDLDTSLAAAFAMDESKSLRKQLVQLIVPLSLLASQPYVGPLLQNREVAATLNNTIEEFRAALNKSVTVAHYVDFSRNEIMDGVPMQGTGNYVEVQKAISGISTVSRALNDRLTQAMLDYQYLLVSDPAVPPRVLVDGSSSSTSTASLTGFELSNSFHYYSASADILQAFERQLREVWGLLLSKWHQWHALWTLLAVKQHNAHINKSAGDRTLTEDVHKEFLKNLSLFMRNVTDTAVTDAIRATADSLLARSLGELPRANYAGITADVAAAAALLYPAIRVAWRDTLALYGAAKKSLEGNPLGVKLLLSNERLFYTLLSAWRTQLGDYTALQQSGADETLAREVWQVVSSPTGSKNPTPEKTLRYEAMQRFWSAFIGAHEWAHSPLRQKVAHLHGSVELVYSYAGVPLFVKT